MNKILVIMYIGIILGSCAQQDHTVKSDVTTIKFEDTSTITDIVNANTLFAFDLYQQIEGNENKFFSPYSISLALMLAYTGAESVTKNELASTLNIPFSKSSVLSNYKQLNSLLNRIEDVNQPDSGAIGENVVPEGIILNIANSVWGNNNLSFQEKYQEDITGYLQSEINTIDFSQSETAAEKINDWISEQTENKINNIISPSLLNAEIRFILVNAIYFYGRWDDQFDEHFTQIDKFYLLDGNTVNIPLMNDITHRNFYSNDQYQAVEMFYRGREFSMVIFVPSEGEFNSFKEKLTEEVYLKTLEEMETVKLDLVLPKFTYESTVNLKSILSNLGLETLFTDQADLSGINGQTGTGIDQAIHKAYVSVDEKGTEAAGVTALLAGTGFQPETIYELKINRPFIYIIRDSVSGAVLFIGEMADPS